MNGTCSVFITTIHWNNMVRNTTFFLLFLRLMSPSPLIFQPVNNFSRSIQIPIVKIKCFSFSISLGNVTISCKCHFKLPFKNTNYYIIPAKSAKATCYKNIPDTTSACFHSIGYFGEWDAYLAVLRTSFQPPNEWPLDSLLILTLLHRDLRPADQCVNWERWINALSDKLLSLSLSLHAHS